MTRLVMAYTRPKMKCAIANHRTYIMVRPRVGFTTPYPMHTMSSRKKENEFLTAFKMPTRTSKTLDPTFEPFRFK